MPVFSQALVSLESEYVEVVRIIRSSIAMPGSTIQYGLAEAVGEALAVDTADSIGAGDASFFFLKMYPLTPAMATTITSTAMAGPYPCFFFGSSLITGISSVSRSSLFLFFIGTHHASSARPLYKNGIIIFDENTDCPLHCTSQSRRSVLPVPQYGRCFHCCWHGMRHLL